MGTAPTKKRTMKRTSPSDPARSAGDGADRPGSTPLSTPINRANLDRRSGADRRLLAADGQPANSFERRRGAGRRLSDSQRTAEEGDLNAEQFLFVAAIDSFKKANGVCFPTWTDVLEVIRLLGYRKTMPSEVNLRNAEDWREAADAPANVRPKGWERRFAA